MIALFSTFSPPHPHTDNLCDRLGRVTLGCGPHTRSGSAFLARTLQQWLSEDELHAWVAKTAIDGVLERVERLSMYIDTCLHTAPDPASVLALG